MLKSKMILNIKRKHPPLKVKLKNPDYKLIVFFIIFFCGTIIGGFIAKNSTDALLSVLSGLVKEYFINLTAQSHIVNFIKIFSPFLFICVCTYIIGLCAVGIPFLSVAPFMLGVAMGTAVGQYYIAYGFEGIGCCALIYLPLFATATATLIKGCCCSFDISGEIFYFVVSGKGSAEALLKSYTIKHLFFLVPIIIASVVTLVLHHFFSGLFSFAV